MPARGTYRKCNLTCALVASRRGHVHACVKESPWGKSVSKADKAGTTCRKVDSGRADGHERIWWRHPRTNCRAGYASFRAVGKAVFLEIFFECMLADNDDRFLVRAIAKFQIYRRILCNK